MTVYVDYEMVSKLAKDVRKSQEIKDKLFKEFVSWYFEPMTNSHFKGKTEYVFHELNSKLDTNFEEIVNEFLEENYNEEE